MADPLWSIAMKFSWFDWNIRASLVVKDLAIIITNSLLLKLSMTEEKKWLQRCAKIHFRLFSIRILYMRPTNHYNFMMSLIIGVCNALWEWTRSSWSRRRLNSRLWLKWFQLLFHLPNSSRTRQKRIDIPILLMMLRTNDAGSRWPNIIQIWSTNCSVCNSKVATNMDPYLQKQSLLTWGIEVLVFNLLMKR